MSKNKNVIHLDSLESFSVLTSNDLFSKRYFLVENKKTKKKKKVQPYNQIATCVVRIKETSEYINSLELKRQNTFGEAFNFYEFINCLSIVFGCVETLFELFNLKIEDEYGNKRAFVKSCGKRKIKDISFFKFVRSASSVHPQSTTRYAKITKVRNEYYPYATWHGDEDVLFNDAPKDFDIKLTSWSSKPECFSKHYYLFLDEFYGFADYIVSLISKLNPLVESIIYGEKEKLRCKRLKDMDSFPTRQDYCLYLRKRLSNKNTNKYEFADGGLLIASHILGNNLLSQEFKDYIFSKVEPISKQMKIDLTEIGFDDAVSGLYLGDCINDDNCYQPTYVTEKFHDYLEKEVRYEIESNDYRPFRPALRDEKNNLDYSDAEWVANLLLTRITDFYDIEKIKQAYSYVDLYEITLETIWKKKQGDNKNVGL